MLVQNALLFITVFACFTETDTRQMKYKYIQNQNNAKQNTEKILMADIVPLILLFSFKNCH